MQFSDNPQYKIAETFGDIVLYEPASDTDYHMSRYIAANAQNIYASAGTTKELLSKIANHAIKICNEKDVKTIKTDIGLLMNNILSRLQYPVDEDCALRMGCLFYFIEGEDPNSVDEFWLNKKLNLAKGEAKEHSPAMYNFFLSKGLINTPAYSELLECLSDRDYFQKRKEMLAQLIPQ